MVIKRAWLGILAIILVFGVLISGCSVQNQIIGTWVGNTLGIETELTFGRDGTYTERALGLNISGTYSIHGNRIIVNTALIGTITYDDVRIDGNRLFYTFMGTIFTYTRR